MAWDVDNGEKLSVYCAGLQSAGSFGNGLCSAFAQSASAALDLRAEPSGLLPLCDFMLGEAC
jgi:hypothetical protein